VVCPAAGHGWGTQRGNASDTSNGWSDLEAFPCEVVWGAAAWQAINPIFLQEWL
jgi:hypothetical protein